MVKIDSLKFGLSKRMAIYENKNKITIKITRKTRIIMKDGHRLLNAANKIKKIREQKDICLNTSAPICSKTKKFLEDQGVSVFEL